MKLRIWPILISVVVTGAVLFGGWSVYRSMAMESPLSKLVSSIPGVQDESFSYNNSEVKLKVTLDQDASLRDIYQKLAEEGGSIVGNRKISIEVNNANSSAELDQIWSESLFGVAEAMDGKQFGRIPALMQQITAQHSGVKAVTEMDENNVYVRLVSGNHSKHIILPRTPAMMGVWPNE